MTDKHIVMPGPYDNIGQRNGEKKSVNIICTSVIFISLSAADKAKVVVIIF